MNARVVFIFLLIVMTNSLTVASTQYLSSIGNLKLDSGDTLFDCTVGYRTFGKLNKDKSNAIVFCTWYMGNSEDLQEFIGKNTFIDSTEYFVIAVDALGDGISSSPSNSLKQSGDLFPLISIRDMVRSQYLMIKKEFGISQLYGIIGGSMGGMQVFEWIVTYPEFMKKAIAYVGTPQLPSYNRLFFSLQKKIIELGKKYSMSEGDQSILYSMAFALVLRTPEFINKNVPYDSFEKYLSEFQNDTIRNPRFLNLRSQLTAMIHHDISRNNETTLDAVATKIKTQLLCIVADNDLTVNPELTIRFAKKSHAQVLHLNNNCGHLAPGCELEKSSTAISNFLKQ